MLGLGYRRGVRGGSGGAGAGGVVVENQRGCVRVVVFDFVFLLFD